MTDLTKRAWDHRILHVNLSPVLRVGDTPGRIVEIIPQALYGQPSLVISNISLDGNNVSFLVVGGNAGQPYRLLIRFEVASMPGQMIEAVTRLRVER